MKHVMVLKHSSVFVLLILCIAGMCHHMIFFDQRLCLKCIREVLSKFILKLVLIIGSASRQDHA
ncbi:hypothetical protein ACP70R_018968 [Stipagrostis hirtigluma subsp. patula]